MVSKRIKAVRWWLRTGTEVRAIVFLTGIILLSLLVYLQRPSDESVFLQSNLVVFAFVNLNIVFIFILAFLIGRNIIKLIFDRRRNILGSKLRLKLVTAFVGLALVPTVVIYLLASGLLNQAMEGWFSRQVEDSVQGSVAIAQRFYDSMGKSVKRAGAKVAAELEEQDRLQRDNEALNRFLKRIRIENDLFSIALVDAGGQEILASQHTAAAIDDFRPPQPEVKIISRVLSGSADLVRGEQGTNQFIRSYTASKFKEQPIVVVATFRVGPRISELFTRINDSYREYQQIKLFKNPLRSGYILTLALVTGLILFSAIWIGFYIAREIAIPIQKLAEGTQAVASGDYDYFVRPSGDDEVAFLVRSFNRMTADLKQSRKDAERRRVLIEAILASLTVGVVALDKRGLISTANQAALDFLELGTLQSIRGQPLITVLPDSFADSLQGFLPNFDINPVTRGPELVEDETEFEVTIDGIKHRFTMAISPVRSEEDEDLGMVLIVDDITNLVKAQQMVAWREVARRIAHEIKNPLTPLQLCAQRLQKLLGGPNQDQAVIDSTETIVEHVASIKRLADEFSKFARMPTVEFSPLNISQVISNVVLGYVDANSDIVFKCIIAPDLPEIYADREAIRRVFINLIDNAITAIRSVPDPNSEKAVIVEATLPARQDTIRIEVVDSGLGISEANKARIFEPYFTTHASGTGLGLAVVNSIVADHFGSIRVLNNMPRGARFVVELPIDARALKQRKQVG